LPDQGIPRWTRVIRRARNCLVTKGEVGGARELNVPAPAHLAASRAFLQRPTGHPGDGRPTLDAETALPGSPVFSSAIRREHPAVERLAIRRSGHRPVGRRPVNFTTAVYLGQPRGGAWLPIAYNPTWRGEVWVPKTGFSLPGAPPRPDRRRRESRTQGVHRCRMMPQSLNARSRPFSIDTRKAEY
jgi:hypothetical protein